MECQWKYEFLANAGYEREQKYLRGIQVVIASTRWDTKTPIVLRRPVEMDILPSPTSQFFFLLLLILVFPND